MPKGKNLTDEERREIYEARMAGWSRAEIAQAYGVATDSVTSIVRRWRESQEKENNMAGHECIVAGDKKNGRLISASDLHRYEGTCIIGGKSHTKTFTAENANAAKKLWEQWCDEIRSKQKKPSAVAEKQPVAEVSTPKKEEPKVMKEEPKVIAVHKADEPSKESVYIIWTKGDNPRLFGAYSNMDAALKELDNLNEISSFLVNERVFDVEELPLKS